MDKNDPFEHTDDEDIVQKCHQCDRSFIWDDNMAHGSIGKEDLYLEIRFDVVLPSRREGAIVIFIARHMTAEQCNAQPTQNVIKINLLLSLRHRTCFLRAGISSQIFQLSEKEKLVKLSRRDASNTNFAKIAQAIVFKGKTPW